jgi:hypothetical protein
MQVKALSNAGTKPREILSAIWQSTNHVLLARDLFNAQSKLRLKNLLGKSPMEALIATLDRGEYHFNYRTDSIG